jgi:hypothetical protein
MVRRLLLLWLCSCNALKTDLTQDYPRIGACDNGRRDTAEQDVDCGGPCTPCPEEGGACTGDDCGTCQDGLRTGSETAIDCGGPCAACSDGSSCNVAADCASGRCEAGACVSCTDSAQSGAEAAIDCGGPCAACSDGSSCNVAADCSSGRCEAGACASCTDGAVSGAEAAVDCGGPCGTCADGSCSVAADCASGRCEDRVCRTCTDGAESGAEAAVDCGGPCLACTPEIAVNDAAAGAQVTPSVMVFSGGDFAVGWCQDAGYVRFFRRYGDADSGEMWATSCGKTAPAGAFATVDAGSVIAVGGASVRARHFDAGGALAEDPVAVVVNGTVATLCTAGNGNGRYAIAYATGGALSLRVFAEGAFRSPTAVAAGVTGRCEIAMADNGSLALTWLQMDDGCARARLGTFNAEGSWLAPALAIDDGCIEGAGDVWGGIDMGSEGGVVAWSQSDGAYYQRFLRVGGWMGTRRLLHSGGSQVRVAQDGDGNLVFAWYQQSGDPSYGGIWATMLSDTDASLLPMTRVNVHTDGMQSRPTVGIADGFFVVAWQSDGQDGDASGIYARVSRTLADESAPTAVLSPDGDVSIAPATALSIRFSEGMDRTATEAAIRLEPATAGHVEWSGDPWRPVLNFRHAQLLPSTLYTFSVDAQAADLAGNAIAPRSVTFRTVQPTLAQRDFSFGAPYTAEKPGTVQVPGVQTMTLDPQGRIVVVSRVGDTQHLHRLLADGTSDPSLDFTLNGAAAGIKAVVVDAAGRILVVDSNAQTFAILATGSVDESFADAGVLRASGEYFVLDPQDRLLYAGDNGLRRYLPSGDPDVSFDTDGVAPVSAQNDGYLRGVIALANGSYITWGKKSYETPHGYRDRGVVSRFDGTGTRQSAYVTVCDTCREHVIYGQLWPLGGQLVATQYVNEPGHTGTSTLVLFSLLGAPSGGKQPAYDGSVVGVDSENTLWIVDRGQLRRLDESLTWLGASSESFGAVHQGLFVDEGVILRQADALLRVFAGDP